MDKKFLSIGVLAVAVVAAGIYFASSGGTPEENQSLEGENNNQTAGTVNPSGEYSINELLAMNRPMKCTWKESLTGEEEITNTIYINGKRFYQEVIMGDVGRVYTVSDGDYLYIWNDFTDAASKIKLSEMEASAGSGQTEDAAGLEQKRDFVCESWTADNSIFNPPQGKNFEDITEEIKRAAEGLQ